MVFFVPYDGGRSKVFKSLTANWLDIAIVQEDEEYFMDIQSSLSDVTLQGCTENNGRHFQQSHVPIYGI